MKERLFEVLVKLQSSKNTERKEAEEQLMRWSQEEFGELSSSLCEILLEAKEMTSAVTAGIVLKTFFVWESEEKRKLVNARWMALSEKEREQLKEKMAAGLQVCEAPLGGVLAQCLSTVARLEVVARRWDTVFIDLAEILAKAKSETAQQNVIKTIGNLCMDTSGMDSSIIAGSSGSILTAIISSAKEENTTTKLCAFECLHQSMGFISHNIEIKEECLAIMKEIYNGCKSSHLDVACKALECFGAALSMHSAATLKYVEVGFGDVTVEYLRSEEDQKILGAIEIWGTVCTLAEEEGAKTILEKAFPVIAGEMLAVLQVDNLERIEEWAPYKAAAWLLSQMFEKLPERVQSSVAVKECEKTAPVFTLVEKMVRASDLGTYEAGVSALGAMLNEDTGLLLVEPVHQVLGTLLQALTCPNITVIETSLWALEKVFRHAYASVTPKEVESTAIARVMEITKRPGEVAVCAAWTLAEVFSAIHEAHAEEMGSGAWEGIPHAPGIVEMLMEHLGTLQETEYSLRVSLTSAISEVARSCALQSQKTLLVISQDVVAHIKAELSSSKTSEENIYCYLSILQACVQGQAQVSPDLALEIINIVTFILGNANLLGLYTDVYLMLGALADATGLEFGNYADRVKPLVVRDLGRLGTNISQEEGFTAFATSLLSFVGTMATATKLGFNIYVDEIMSLIIYAITTPYLTKEAQIAAISTFADISLSVGKIFEKYLGSIFEMSAFIINIKDDGSDSEFILALREALLDLLSCIVQSSDGKSKTVAENLAGILSVIKVVAEETNDVECVVKALYLISDMWVLYGNDPAYPYTAQYLNEQWILEFISAKLQSSNKEVKEAAASTRYQISTQSQE
ncbi:importin subunit beta-1 [Nematocida sp. AWRm77]|nr:importin subunit beta-1 [Nematocida sp. AWRm77]